MSNLFDISSLAMIPTAYKDGKLYSVRPIEELGNELVTNGNFSSGSTGWTLGTGWSISGGYATHTGSTGNLTSNASLTNGTKYKVAFEIVSISGGVCNVYDTSSGTTYASFDSVGVKSVTITKNSGGSLAIRSSSANAVIDNVSIKEAIVANGDFTFSRGTTATRVASSGYIEKGRENLLLQSNTFNTTWVNYNSTQTSGQSGYDGSNDAWLLNKTGLYGQVNLNPSTSGVQTYSVYAKAGSLNFLMLRYRTTSTQYHGSYFDLANGLVGTETSQIIDSQIQSVGNGWYRCSITFNQSLNLVYIYAVDSDGGIANGTSGNIYIQDAQLEAGLVATDYIETTTTSVSAGILEDMPRLDYSGSCPALLLEPQRTNLVLQSEYYNTYWSTTSNLSITDNYGQSPEGLNNASRWVSTGGSFPQMTRTMVGLTIGQSYTASFYVKSDGTSQIQQTIWFTGFAGTNFTPSNEWVRITNTFTATATSHTFVLFTNGVSAPASSYLLYGIQIEAGSYPTSYIPTYGASVTRSKDFVSLTGASDLMNVNGTTILLEVQGISNGGDSRRFSISDGTYNNRVVIELDETADNIKVFLVGNSVVGASLTITSIDQTNNNKIAVAFDGSGVIVYINGEYKTQDTSITLPTALSEIKFRDGGGSNLEMEGYVKQAIVFPTRLTDTELASLTTL